MLLILVQTNSVGFLWKYLINCSMSDYYIYYRRKTSDVPNEIHADWWPHYYTKSNIKKSGDAALMLPAASWM